jgi:hypothetical protein|tara:strand:- start:16 stop:225 length:210 start_codon:yes stop_codon:yes gene_type:complete
MAGLYENIHKKRKRIEQGSGEKMRKPGEEGAPSAKDFRDSEKTAKKEKQNKTVKKKMVASKKKGSGTYA